MSDPTITPEQVMAAGCRQRARAERIAVYANRRADGDLRLDAGRGLDVAERTLSRYENWANVVRRGLGLADLPAHTPKGHLSADLSPEANHNQWHDGRGVTSPTCPHCPGGEP